MRKVIAAINMTLDGFCDHTAITPDDEIHDHYANLLKEAGVILYGRITFGLMEYWRDIVAKPTGIKAMDDFAVTMDKVPKIVFSHTLKTVEWDSATLSNQTLEEAVAALKQQPGKDIFIGSRSLIMQLMKSDLLDELQLCVHPVIAGGGMLLFENLNQRKLLQLVHTKTMSGGAIILYYQPAKTQ